MTLFIILLQITSAFGCISKNYDKHMNKQKNHSNDGCHINYSNQCSSLSGCSRYLSKKTIFPIFAFTFIIYSLIFIDIENYRLAFIDTKFTDTDIKFYLLDDPYIEIGDPRSCQKNDSDLFSALFDHPCRTLNISLADILIPKWSKQGYLTQPGCFTNRPLNNLTKNDGRSLYYNREARLKIIDDEIKYFHDLKRKNIVKKKSIIHFREVLNENLDIKYKLHKDVSFGSMEVLHGGFISSNRNKLDISLPLSLTALTKLADSFNLTNLNCSGYNNDLILFFQGRNHGSWLSKNAFIFNDSYEGLNFRTKNPRLIISKALETNEALEKGIVINTRSRHEKNYPKKLDYRHYMSHSHFCLVISGNQPWSYRFYESLIAGCIPVIVSGGWELPFTPAVKWDKIVIRIEENFNWSDIDGLLDRLWGKNPYNQNHILHNIYQNDICRWHKAVRYAWIEYFSSDKLWTELFINSIKIKYNNFYNSQVNFELDKDIGEQNMDLALTSKDLIFLHIPRNAGTYIGKLFLDNGILNGMYAGIDFSGSNSKKYKCHNFHRPPIRFIPNSFCIVRNIYLRLISIYLYNRSKSGRRVSNFNKCHCFDFLNYTKNRMNSYANGDININDCHYIPQWSYAKHAKYILRFENFSMELNELFEKFGIKNYNISKKINQSDIKCNNITLDCFDEELLKLVNGIYNEDFIYLNYKKIIP